MKQYYFDPDYRKEPPKEGPFCIRCQKPVDPKRAKEVTEVRDMQCVLGGKSLIGPDCWKEIQKNVMDACPFCRKEVRPYRMPFNSFWTFECCEVIGQAYKSKAQARKSWENRCESREASRPRMKQ